jgi:phosphoribosylformylglycinamidine synthase
MGGSEYLAYRGMIAADKPYTGNNVPRVDAAAFAKIYRALEKAMEQGLVASSISLERGGLGVALAKSAVAGLMGCVLDLSAIASSGITRNDILLYSESQGRILVSVDPANQEKFEACFEGLQCALAGEVLGNKRVIIKDILR